MTDPHRTARPKMTAAPDDVGWERPRRPASDDRPNGPVVAAGVVLAVVAVAAWLTFRTTTEDPPATAGAPATAGGHGEPDGAADPDGGFALVAATWGPVDDGGTRAGPAPEPAEPTAWQQRERAFEQAMRERLKGTEVFVRRRER